jgi:hypothetical protein
MWKAEEGGREGKRECRSKGDMWKAEREARGEAGSKETCGRLRGRQEGRKVQKRHMEGLEGGREGKREGRSKRDLWKAEREAGKEVGN